MKNSRTIILLQIKNNDLQLFANSLHSSNISFLFFSNNPNLHQLPFINHTNNIHNYLGTTNNFVVLSADTFNVDYIFALYGSLSVNGILLCTLTNYSNNYFTFVKSKSLKYGVITVTYNDFMFNSISLKRIDYYLSIKRRTLANYKLTNEQMNFISLIFNNLEKQIPFKIHLSGERGIGKTTTLNYLLQKSLNFDFKIGILSNSYNKSLFFNKESINIYDITLENFTNYKNLIDLLIVDECASIPLAKLELLTRDFKNIILSSTAFGYEGSGNGINVLFTPKYNVIKYELTKRHRNIVDKGELFLNDISFYNNQINTFYTDNSHINPQDIQYQLLDISSLLDKESSICQINQLLVNNHYQFSKNDIVRWVQNNSSYFIVALHKNIVIGVVIATMESLNNNKELINYIYEGTRQPRNNLLPQTLIAHVGMMEAGYFSFLRIERIAVNHNYRHLKIGTNIVNKVFEFNNKSIRADFIGVSCANKIENIKFWEYNKFELVNIGISKDNASGLESLIFLQYQNAESSILLFKLKEIFNLRIKDIFNRYQISNEETLKKKLTTDSTGKTITTIFINSIINVIANNKHSIEHSYSIIKLFLSKNKDYNLLLTNTEYQCIKLFIENNTVDTIEKETKIVGKKQIHRTIRIALKKILGT